MWSTAIATLRFASLLHVAYATPTCTDVRELYSDAGCCEPSASQTTETDIRTWDTFENSEVPINILFLTGNDKNCSLTYQPFVPKTFGPKVIRDRYSFATRNMTAYNEDAMNNPRRDYRDDYGCVVAGMCRDTMDYDVVNRVPLGRRVVTEANLYDPPGVEVQSASFEELSALEAEVEQLERPVSWMLELLHPESKNNPLFSLKNRLFWTVNIFGYAGLMPDGTPIPLPYGIVMVIIFSFDIRTGWRRQALLNKQPGMPAMLAEIDDVINPNFLKIEVLDPRVKPDDIFGDVRLMDAYCRARVAPEPLVTGYEISSELRLRAELNVAQNITGGDPVVFDAYVTDLYPLFE